MHVDVTVRGHVPEGVAEAAAEQVAALERFAKGPLTAARVVLVSEHNPRIPYPARAHGGFLLAGRPIRARVAAPSMSAAVDAVTDRLRDQLRRHVDRMVTGNHRSPTVEPGEWRHRAWTPPRPPRS
jgi:ribosome-associated translation inhibitor RaiA